MSELDAAVRLRAFDFLTEQRRRFGEASLPRSVFARGFDFEGVRVPLIGPQGIFKPAILPEIPSPSRPPRPSSTATAPTMMASPMVDCSATAIAARGPSRHPEFPRGDR